MEMRSHKILEYLNEKDKESFIADLVNAVDNAEREGNIQPLILCLDKWEAVAELNAIPGLRDRVWNRFKHYKTTGRIQ